MSIDATTELSPFLQRNVDAPTSREQFELFVEGRSELANRPKLDGPALLAVQEDVRSWIAEQPFATESLDYTAFDQANSNAKLGGLISYLSERHLEAVSTLELDVTQKFIDATFAMYQDETPLDEVDRDGSFAFVVPLRLSRNDPEYGAEVESFLPALRYVPNELRSLFMAGLPPFIVDTYHRDQDGKRGYLLWGGICQDMFPILPETGATDSQNFAFLTAGLQARANVNATVDFAARRLGVTIVGLGATIPAITNYGQSVMDYVRSNPDPAVAQVITTTGHGGTDVLIDKAVNEAVARGYIKASSLKRLGIIGLGSIGSTFGRILGAKHPDAEFSIYDTKASKVTRTARDLNKLGVVARAADSIQEVFETADVVVVAVTTPIDLDGVAGDLSGKFIIDDSQPGRISLDQVLARKATMTWPIGLDASGQKARTIFDYGTMANGAGDLFGCEAEAATLARYRSELLSRGLGREVATKILSKVAIQRAVDPVSAGRIRVLFDRYDITTAQFQAFGRNVMLPQA